MIRVFLSSPYSHPNPAIMEDRARMAEDACAWLTGEGYLPLSPIAMWHRSAARNNMPTNANAWMGWNRAWLGASDAVAHLMLEGWEDSAGMAMERAWADEADMPQARIGPWMNSFRVHHGQLHPPRGAVYCDGQWEAV